MASFLVRECGLKLAWMRARSRAAQVTPRVGVWVETISSGAKVRTKRVTPCAGVWVETIEHVRGALVQVSYFSYGSVD